MEARSRAERSVAADGPSRLVTWAATRRPYLDNLKVALIAAVIVIHAVLGYATVEVWTYTELREVTLAPVTETALLVLASPFGFFMMALLFLVAGLLTPGSLDRKGPGRFVRDRALRLGVPFVVYVLIVQPTLVYALRWATGDAPGSYAAEYLAVGRLDTGPLWFVGVLLVFSLGYAAWHAGVPGRSAAGSHPRPLTWRVLLLTVSLVAPASFLVRLVYPYGGESGVTDLNLWEWPACIAVFCVGIGAARQGWLTAIPDRFARGCRDATLGAALAMAALLVTVGLLDTADDAMGGWHWEAAAFAAIEAVLTVLGSVWLLRVAQVRLDRRFRWGSVLSRSAYGGFMLQTFFLLGFAVLLRPLGMPAEVKALLVAVGAVVCSFATAGLLVKRVPGLSRIL